MFVSQCLHCHIVRHVVADEHRVVGQQERVIKVDQLLKSRREPARLRNTSRDARIGSICRRGGVRSRRRTARRSLRQTGAADASGRDAPGDPSQLILDNSRACLRSDKVDGAPSAKDVQLLVHPVAGLSGLANVRSASASVLASLAARSDSSIVSRAPVARRCDSVRCVMTSVESSWSVTPTLHKRTERFRWQASLDGVCQIGVATHLATNCLRTAEALRRFGSQAELRLRHHPSPSKIPPSYWRFRAAGKRMRLDATLRKRALPEPSKQPYRRRRHGMWQVTRLWRFPLLFESGTLN